MIRYRLMAVVLFISAILLYSSTAPKPVAALLGICGAAFELAGIVIMRRKTPADRK